MKNQKNTFILVLSTIFIFLDPFNIFKFAPKNDVGDTLDDDYYNSDNENSTSDTISQQQSTLSDAKAQSLATQLYQAMEYAWSDNALIKSLLSEIGTEPNFIHVSDKFGVEPFDGSWGGIWTWGAPEYNLTQWLNHELDDDSGRRFLKNLFPNIF
jgi:hypothetical protein